MKIDYTNTINLLKSNGLITEDDIILVGTEAVSAGTMAMFGAIGAALAASSKDDAVVTVSVHGFKFFVVDKKTGAYANQFTPIEKQTVKRCGIAGLGQKQLVIKTNDGKINYAFTKRFKGFEQAENLKAFCEFVKANYKK